MNTATTPVIASLAEHDLAGALQISSAAGWNQTASDWRMLFRLAPDGCFALHADGKLVATTSLLRYEDRLGWIGMVLTHADYRRRGFAHALLEHVLTRPDAERIATLKLDATEQGQPLYERLGFTPEQPVERWLRPGNSELPATDQCRQSLEACLTMDREAFGLDRSTLLRDISKRSAIFTSENAFIFRRPGLNAQYMGPFVSRNTDDTRALVIQCIQNAGEAACFWDLLPRNTAAVDLARDLGFVRHRELVRMRRGAPYAGRDAWIWGIAGFELG
ncbi:MAG: GNAT family N-acetyltransferase [Acidobacteriaceae bacterium]|nr:GNAT family N-acetyltransferase [Acidobacteriaceae bacterium]